MAPRFFIEGVHVVGDVVRLGDADARKVAVVLRMHPGDPIEAIDSSGQRFSASLRTVKDSVEAMLEATIDRPTEARLRIVLAQCIPKAQKMEFVVEKATELGVAEILPVQSERTVAHASGGGKVERWRRVARSAAQQCGRTTIPIVAEPVSWDGLIARFAGAQLALVPWELAERAPLRDVLPQLLAGVESAIVAIGPEGGISHGEAERAFAAGARGISLGSRILRTETAGLVAVAAMLYAGGEL